MIKKVIVVVVMVFLVSAAYADEGKAKSNKFRIDELAILPHPGKFVKNGIIKLNPEQKKQLKMIKKKYPPIFQAKLTEAFKLEKRLRRAVTKGRNKEELKILLDELAMVKREAMDSRIDALNAIQKILGEEDWKKVNALTYK